MVLDHVVICREIRVRLVFRISLTNSSLPLFQGLSQTSDFVRFYRRDILVHTTYRV